MNSDGGQTVHEYAYIRLIWTVLDTSFFLVNWHYPVRRRNKDATDVVIILVILALLL